jgi:spermidine synthase
MGPHGNREATRADTAFGPAELRPDPRHPQGWTLFVDGVPQSYVDLADPGHVEYSYLARLGMLVRLWKPVRVRQRFLHLGGGGLTLPRLIDHERPGSAQRVVEIDPALVALITRTLPPPTPVELVTGDARDALESSLENQYDVIVADAFEGGWMPDRLATTGFAAAAKRALAPGGLFLMNLTDVPPLSRARVQTATLRSVFADVCVVADADVLRGRKAGNVIFAAGDDLGALPARAAALHGDSLQTFSMGATARLDEPG